jgi:predicted DNA-binding transcriptional regulator AlpA
MSSPEPYLNERQVSALTGLSLGTLRAYRFKGIGPSYFKVGRAVRYRASDVENFMAGCRIIPSQAQDKEGGAAHA